MAGARVWTDPIGPSPIRGHAEPGRSFVFVIERRYAVHEVSKAVFLTRARDQACIAQPHRTQNEAVDVPMVPPRFDLDFSFGDAPFAVVSRWWDLDTR